MTFLLPTVGRIVHYVLPGGHSNMGQVRPAIVVRVDPEDKSSVSLTVFHDNSIEEPVDSNATCTVQFSDDGRPRSWHWPPR